MSYSTQDMVSRAFEITLFGNRRLGCRYFWARFHLTVELKRLYCLTLNRPGFLDDLEAGGVRKYVTFVFVVLDCNFYANHSFMVSNENFGLYLSVESIIFILCCAVLWWDCLEGSYIDRSNLLGQFLKNRRLWPICTICTSNESRKYIEFNFW